MSAIPERVRAIIEDVATLTGVPAKTILSDRVDHGPITDARWSAMRRVRALVMHNGKNPSYPQIGRWFGRDHSSVMNACVKAPERVGNSRYRDPSPRLRELVA